jgi:prepilin-type N-terminal cleavage/methylation domain-containing protein
MRRVTAIRGGFTLIEIIMVLVIMVLLATVAIPRFADNDRRRFKLAVEQVGDMLTMFAQRQMLEERLVGIAYDPEGHRILMLQQEAEPPDGMPAEWFIDPYVQPIRLPDPDPRRAGEPGEVELIEVLADGDPVDVVQWPLASAPQEERPTVSLTLQSDKYLATITLPPQGITPEVTGLDGPGSFTAYEPMDLDSAGRTRDAW